MEWTAEKPTVPGWYWFEDEKDGHPEPMYIDESDIACADDDFCPRCHSRAYSSLQYPGRWSDAPILEPDSE
jgi:hypothetical protein